MAEDRPAPRQGLSESANPRSEREGPPPAQQQEWPGSESGMRPRPDHGEETYRGAGKLAGRKALITGGDSGIGRAVAIAFAREGADVSIAYYSEHDDARETAEWVRKAGRRVLAFDGDLTDRDHCRDVVRRTAGEFGGLDLLVNNAATQSEKHDIREIEPEQLERTFRTNIFAMFWMVQAALDPMGEGSAIINTGSVTGLRGHKGLIDYAATKGAIHNFTKSMAASLSERAIRVNCVAPGPVWTPLIPSGLSKEHVGHFGTNTMWQRPAQPAEIAPSYVFLASADARFYTGEILAPTGESDTTR